MRSSVKLGLGVASFILVFAALNLVPIGRWLKIDQASGVRGTGDQFDGRRDEEYRQYKQFVLKILQSRRTKPARSPEEWMRFLASLDAWYRSDVADCTSTLQREGFGAVLNAVEEPVGGMSTPMLQSLSREVVDSKTAIQLYEELWKRSSLEGSTACAQLYASLPKIYKPIFKDRFVKALVAAEGARSLADIARDDSISGEDVLNAFELCAKSQPSASLDYLNSEDFRRMQETVGAKVPERHQFLSRVALAFPVETALAFLDKEPSTAFREVPVCRVVVEAVKSNPKDAAAMITRYPGLGPDICQAAYSVATKDPRAAAQILNQIPGERLRTSAARQIGQILRQSSKDQMDVFISALSEPLTRETVRTATEKLQSRALPKGSKN